MRVQAIHRGAEAQRFAQEPPPYGADWPEVAYEADVIFAYVSEPREACPRFYLSGGQSAEKALGGVAREVVNETS